MKISAEYNNVEVQDFKIKSARYVRDINFITVCQRTSFTPAQTFVKSLILRSNPACQSLSGRESINCLRHDNFVSKSDHWDTLFLLILHA